SRLHSGAQGSPRTIYRRAIEHGNLMLAEVTAREVGHFTLGEALELTALVAHKAPERHSRPVAARLTAQRKVEPTLLPWAAELRSSAIRAPAPLLAPRGRAQQSVDVQSRRAAGRTDRADAVEVP